MTKDTSIGSEIDSTHPREWYVVALVLWHPNARIWIRITDEILYSSSQGHGHKTEPPGK